MMIRKKKVNWLSKENLKQFITKQFEKEDSPLCLTLDNSNQINQEDLINLFYFISLKKIACKLEGLPNHLSYFNAKFAKLYNRRLIEKKLKEIAATEKNQISH